MPAPFEIQVLSIDPVSWTPVTVAFDCNSLSVKNADPANPVKFRTNVASVASEDTLGPGMEQALAGCRLLGGRRRGGRGRDRHVLSGIVSRA
jgi:hypothetical protein